MNQIRTDYSDLACSWLYRQLVTLLVFSSSLAVISGRAAANDVEQLEQQALVAAADVAAKYVVRIETIGGLEKVGQVLVNMGPTSGVVVDGDGWIISSAYNFIQDPTSIMVQLPDGKRKAARIVSRDKSRGLVLLKVDVEEPLQVPDISVDKLRVGQWAIAIGRTLPGADYNMTVGIISATNRIWSKAVQTDANVSPANYGGALANIRGEVLGVLVPMSPDSADDVAGAEWYDSGIGFCVPLAAIMNNLDRLKETDLYSGKLGVSMKEADLYGAKPVIGVCRPKSPAREAGMKAGDTIVSINGVGVETQSQMKHVLGPLLAGETIQVSYERDGAKTSTNVTLTDKLVPYEHPFLGILPAREQQNVDAVGVKVRHVFDNSPAADALTVDHTILEYNGTATNTVDALRQAIAGSEPGDDVALKVSVDGGQQEVTLTLATLPSSIEEELPQLFPKVEESNEELPQLGKINVKLPEEVGECLAYVPENYDPRFAHSLLVLLPEPGKQKVDELIKQWKPLCDEHGTILLLPQAKGVVMWLPTETKFIRKTIENVRSRYNLDSERIAVMGANSSGAMSYLTAFTHRDLIRGVVPISAGIPGRSPQIFNEPLKRLAVLLIGPEEGRVTQRLAQNAKLLRKLKFPVIERTSSESIDDNQRQEVLRWLDSLDRI